MQRVGWLLFPVFLMACGSPDSDSNAADAGESFSQFDPAPEVTTPGETGCTGCPDSDEDNFTLTLDNLTNHSFSGLVNDAMGDGVFYVDGPGNRGLVGPIDTADDGNFSIEIPLFCGQQLVKCVWSNAQGQYVLATEVTVENCVEPDIRVTLTWDDLGDDWELHLIREGGTINGGPEEDCTWNTCVGGSGDWGQPGDLSDDPVKDVDNTDAFGPENIFLASPEDMVYTVMVEHWSNGDPMSDGQVIFNIDGNEPVVVGMQDLAYQEVWTAGTITWPAGTVTTSQDVFDCSGNWSSGCLEEIPAR